MAHQGIKVPIIGQDIERTALKLNAQTSINLYPEVGETEAVNARALSPTPGLKLLGNTSEGEMRGLVEHSDRLFCVSGNKFIEITLAADNSATFTTRGTVSTAAEPMAISTNNTQIFLTGGGDTRAYVFTPLDNTFEEVSDADFPGAISVTQIDGYFFTAKDDSQQINASAIGDGSSWNALDFIEADFRSDRVVNVSALSGELWAFGDKTIQVYYNSANATGFPFSQRTNAKINFGCAAKDSVQNFNNGLIFLDSRGYVTLAQGYQTQIVSTISVNKAIRDYDRIDDAVGLVYSDRGHLFYQLSFPTAGVSWVYDAFTQAWHRRTSVQSGVEGRHLANNYIRFNNIHLMGSYVDGKLFQLDFETATDDSSAILRERTSQHIHEDRKMVYIDSIEVYVDVDNVPASGQGSTPEIMMQYSKDGGYTWSSELWRSMGTGGDYKKRITWNRLGRARSWTFRFKVSDPVSPTIISGFARVRNGQ